MLPSLLSALIVCAASLVLGQGVLRLCGRREWSWLAGPIGLTAMMVLASPALHLPGRAVTCGVIIGIVTLAAAVALLRERPTSFRPGAWGLACGLWPLAMALVPFAVAGRGGILGVSLINDMTSHLLWAQGIMDQRVVDVNGINNGYPLGPHFVAAAIAATTGMSPAHAFTGLVIALPVLLGWTALAAVRDAGWWRQLVVVAVCGTPFLIASYFGESGFKELCVPMFLLAFAIMLDDLRTAKGASPVRAARWRWVPMGAMAVGLISVYSYTGVLWPGLLLVLWLAALVGAGLWTHAAGFARVAVRTVRGELVAIGIAAGVTALALLPQWARIAHYVGNAFDTGGVIGQNDTGNLVSRVSPWEALGMWDNPDFRYPAHDALTVGVWSGLVLVLFGVGTVLWVRRGRWAVPLAAASAWLIWVYTDHTQSIYVGPKALAVLTVPLMLTASAVFLERPRGAAMLRGAAVLLPLLALLFVYKVSDASFEALRRAPVGPLDHAEELAQLKPKLNGTTLFLGVDDFVIAELAGKHVKYLLYDLPRLPMRPQKHWVGGHAVDIDVFPTDFLNTVDYVLTPKDAAGSALPSQLRPVAQTKTYALYKREGTIPNREILDEGESPAAILDCHGDRAARKLSRRRGTAAIERGGLAIPVPPLWAGADRTIPVKLPSAGTWDFVMAYTSSLPVTVSAPGMATNRLAPNLDRPGPRYPVGTIRASGPEVVNVRFRVRGHPLSSTSAPAIPFAFIAIPRGTERTVPLREACGKAVDYYQLGR